MAAQAASCRGETSGTALTAGLGCRRAILAAAGARLSAAMRRPPTTTSDVVPGKGLHLQAGLQASFQESLGLGANVQGLH